MYGTWQRNLFWLYEFISIKLLTTGRNVFIKLGKCWLQISVVVLTSIYIIPQIWKVHHQFNDPKLLDNIYIELSNQKKNNNNSKEISLDTLNLWLNACNLFLQFYSELLLLEKKLSHELGIGAVYRGRSSGWRDFRVQKTRCVRYVTKK